MDHNIPYNNTEYCGCSSVVERHVANVNVVSSSLITRYRYKSTGTYGHKPCALVPYALI
jgi:hypothetical protein